MASKALTYRLRPKARADMESIWRYTAQHWSVEQANSYTALFLAAFADLSSGRREGRPIDIRPDYRKLRCGSHIIYYRRNDMVDIVRILHQRMDVEHNL